MYFSSYVSRVSSANAGIEDEGATTRDDQESSSPQSSANRSDTVQTISPGMGMIFVNTGHEDEGEVNSDYRVSGAPKSSANGSHTVQIWTNLALRKANGRKVNCMAKGNVFSAFSLTLALRKANGRTECCMGKENVLEGS